MSAFFNNELRTSCACIRKCCERVFALQKPFINLMTNFGRDVAKNVVKISKKERAFWFNPKRSLFYLSFIALYKL